MGLNAIGSCCHRRLPDRGDRVWPRFRKPQRTLKDYFLADKQIAWWAISLSIVAAETSTLTIISVPGLAYEQDFRFLQLVIGYLIGRFLICFVLIPQYFRGELGL